MTESSPARKARKNNPQANLIVAAARDAAVLRVLKARAERRGFMNGLVVGFVASLGAMALLAHFGALA